VEAIQRGVNALLPPDIRVLRAEEMPWAFHARFSARGKRYEYRIWNGAVVSAFGYRHAWWISRPLDLEAMEAASQALCGVHDFSSFRSANCDGRHAVREVTGCGWVRLGDGLTFWIEANAYLKYMVRSIVGTLVEVGLGRRPADGMAGLMEARDRSAAGITAPARGLFLAEVMYPAPWGFNRRTGGDRAGPEREATPAAGDGVLGPAAGVGDGCMGVEPTGRALWEPIPAPAGGFLRGCPQRS
jgi:tRNA pseudouridine38-40 synthase